MWSLRRQRRLRRLRSSKADADLADRRRAIIDGGVIAALRAGRLDLASQREADLIEEPDDLIVGGALDQDDLGSPSSPPATTSPASGDSDTLRVRPGGTNSSSPTWPDAPYPASTPT